jgi:hypothetical protein
MSSSVDHQYLTQLVLDSAVEITKDQVVERMRLSVTDWRQNRPHGEVPVYVHIPRGKIGSEHWIYLEVKDLLPPHTIVNADTQIPSTGNADEIEILYMDDWSLSGCDG